ncbi:MAG: ATP-binding protein [Thermodesulfobacteriota bacterium]
MAIPTSDMPGHKKLHERVYNALDRCQESISVDFKESAPWEELKWQIIRTALGMGNLRDGGIIIIGASERGSTWDLPGISSEHLATFDTDVVIDVINKYASPPIKIDLVIVTYRNSNIFLAIQVNEFFDTPFVCKKNGPETGKRLREGDVFVRPPGKPRTTRITTAEEMQDLLELAAEKRARRILEVAYRIGLKATDTSIQKFDTELEGL